jgi:hypothetical protein
VTIRLPYEFGTIVYHVARAERLAGVVIGFVVTSNGTKILVRWGSERLDQDECWFHELSTEFTPLPEVNPDA